MLRLQEQEDHHEQRHDDEIGEEHAGADLIQETLPDEMDDADDSHDNDKGEGDKMG